MNYELRIIEIFSPEAIATATNSPNSNLGQKIHHWMLTSWKQFAMFIIGSTPGEVAEWSKATDC